MPRLQKRARIFQERDVPLYVLVGEGDFSRWWLAVPGTRYPFTQLSLGARDQAPRVEGAVIRGSTRYLETSTPLYVAVGRRLMLGFCAGRREESKGFFFFPTLFGRADEGGPGRRRPDSLCPMIRQGTSEASAATSWSALTRMAGSPLWLAHFFIMISMVPAYKVKGQSAQPYASSPSWRSCQPRIIMT